MADLVRGEASESDDEQEINKVTKYITHISSFMWTTSGCRFLLLKCLVRLPKRRRTRTSTSSHLELMPQPPFIETIFCSANWVIICYLLCTSVLNLPISISWKQYCHLEITNCTYARICGKRLQAAADNRSTSDEVTGIFAIGTHGSSTGTKKLCTVAD